MLKGGGFQTVGRRKSAVARVYLRNGSGKFSVNGEESVKYFGRIILDIIVKEPLTITGLSEKYDVIANVTGGGKAGQAGALRMAIGRALIAADAGLRPALKAASVLTRDAREVERKKYGKHKARKRPQFSKR